MRAALLVAAAAATPSMAEANEGHPPPVSSRWERFVGAARPSLVVQAGASTRGAVAGAILDLDLGTPSLSLRADTTAERADRGELLLGWRINRRREPFAKVALAGVRVEPRGVFAVAGGRLGGHERSISLGLVGRIAGDQMFVQHARYVPGWFARGEQRWSRVVLGAELGASGLAERTPAGELRGDSRALVTLGVDLCP